MFHTVEFLDDYVLDVETMFPCRLEKTLVHKGTRVQSRLTPYVVETKWGPVEVADLFYGDGACSRAVRYECFRFID